VELQNIHFHKKLFLCNLKLDSFQKISDETEDDEDSDEDTDAEADGAEADVDVDSAPEVDITVEATDASKVEHSVN
jgi:hypothetical protein